MRPSRQFRPSALTPLEQRVVLSSTDHVGAVTHTSSNPYPNTPILSHFPVEAAALAAGDPVYERWTTTYYDGLTETNDETITLNNQTVTVSKNITLPGTEGTETVVEHYTPTTTGVLFQNSVVEPNGQTETETRTDTPDGSHKTLYDGSYEQPDGVTVNFTGSSVGHGSQNIYNNSFHETNGVTYTTHEVDIHHGPWQTSVTVTTHWGDGSVQVDKSTISGEIVPSPVS
jgi:hypothetical protein